MRQDNAEEGEGEEGGRERPLPMETRLAGGELRCRLRDDVCDGPWIDEAGWVEDEKSEDEYEDGAC